GLTFARLVFPKAAVLAIFAEVSRLHIPAEIPAIDFGFLVFSANLAALHFLRHGFAHLVAEDEGRFVGKPQITAEGQHALALHFVAEDRDSGQIGGRFRLRSFWGLWRRWSLMG